VLWSVAVIVGLAVSGCGSSTPTLSAHDQATLRKIDPLVTQFRTLEGQIGADSIQGSKVRSRAQYLTTEGPRVDQLSRVAQMVRLDVASFDDVKLASLYDPMAEAFDQEAGDMQMFFNSVKADDVKAAQAAYSKLGQDEQHINNVALEQLPKVRTYARTLGFG
jgi:hypothetical protein